MMEVKHQDNKIQRCNKMELHDSVQTKLINYKGSSECRQTKLKISECSGHTHIYIQECMYTNDHHQRTVHMQFGYASIQYQHINYANPSCSETLQRQLSSENKARKGVREYAT